MVNKAIVQVMSWLFRTQKKLVLLVCLFVFSSSIHAECVEGDCFIGYGKESTAAWSYQGDFFHKSRHGEGSYEAADGDKYVGEWARDLPHGQGTYYWKNGDKYVGELWYQRRHGFGVLTQANGEVLEGIWLDGKLMSQEELSEDRWIPLVPMSDQRMKLLLRPNYKASLNYLKGPALYGPDMGEINHRGHPRKKNQVQIKSLAGVIKADHANSACRGFKGTGLEKILTKPDGGHYPELVTATCMTKRKWAKEQVWLANVREEGKKWRAELQARTKKEQRAAEAMHLARDKQLATAQKRLEAEQRLDAERKNRFAAARLEAKKDECTSFGFTPQTPDHAECVMKMAIAEKAQDKSESQAKTLAEQSAAEARAYQAEMRRVQAQQEADKREAREAAKRQREAQLLINLGGAISSGQFPLGNSSEPAFSDEPMPSFGSERYKECFYRVAGDRLSISIPRAQGCPATRNFGSRVGYLTR